MKQYTVNFNGVKTWWDFYETLIKRLYFIIIMNDKCQLDKALQVNPRLGI